MYLHITDNMVEIFETLPEKSSAILDTAYLQFYKENQVVHHEMFIHWIFCGVHFWDRGHTLANIGGSIHSSWNNDNVLYQCFTWQYTLARLEYITVSSSIFIYTQRSPYLQYAIFIRIDSPKQAMMLIEVHKFNGIIQAKLDHSKALFISIILVWTVNLRQKKY